MDSINESSPRTIPKAITNPFSSGGGGVSYEQRVAVYYMISLLTKQKPLGLAGGITNWIRFQARQLGVPLDDLLVQSIDDFNVRHLQLQIKHTLTFTDNSLFREVMADAWVAFSGALGWPFTQGMDRLGIVVSSFSQDVSRHLLPLLESARSYATADEFIEKENTAQYAHAKRRRYLSLIRSVIDTAIGSAITDEQVWMFIRHLVIIRLELESEGSSDLDTAWNRLLDVTPERNPVLAQSIFNALVNLASMLAPRAGTINLGGLQEHVYREVPQLQSSQGFFNDFELEIQKIASVFVAPAQYGVARAKLDQHHLVILTGPPHIGKTSTGLHLALSLRSEHGNRAIVSVGPREDLSTYANRSDLILLLDDCFGSTSFSPIAHGDDFQNVIHLARRNHVIVTTRSEIFAEARSTTRLAEQPHLLEWVVQLDQEESYSEQALTEILEQHLVYWHSEHIEEHERLSAAAVQTAREHKSSIIGQLRFPHNIEVFCRFYLGEVGTPMALAKAIEQSNSIEKAVQNWVINLPLPHRWFVFLVALFPGISGGILHRIYRDTAAHFGFPADDVVHLTRRYAAYLSHSERPRFHHPTYEEAILSMLHSDFAVSIGEIVDAGLKRIIEADILALSQCDNADYAWPRVASGEPFPIDSYLDQFAEAYNSLLFRLFQQIADRLPPYAPGKAGALFLLEPMHGGGDLAIVPTSEEQPLVFVEHPHDLPQRRDDLINVALAAGRPMAFSEIRIRDIIQRSPQIHAYTLIHRNVDVLFQKQRLKESWPLTYIRVETALRKLSYSRIGLHVDYTAPFSKKMYESVAKDFVGLAEFVPDGWSQDVWKRMLSSEVQSLLTLDQAITRLEEQGQHYNGPLLPPPDLQIAHATAAYNRAHYSPTRMRDLIEAFFKFALSAYQEMVEQNFSTVLHRFELCNQSSIKVFGAMTYTRHSGSSLSHFFLLPSDYQLANKSEFEIHVVADHEAPIPRTIPFDTYVKERLERAKASNWIASFSMGPNSFCNSMTLVRTVYKWLQRDLDRALGWKTLGQARRTHQFRANPALGLPPDASQYWNMTRSVDPWAEFDWPSTPD